VDEVRGQAVQKVPKDRVVGAVPDSCVELKVGGDSGVVIGILKLPVPLKQGLKPHEVRELARLGCLTGGFLFKKDPHVIDLDDLLGVNLRNLQSPGYPFKETFLLEAGQRLPDRGPGDAKTFGK
jgi:hypothetical protein